MFGCGSMDMRSRGENGCPPADLPPGATAGRARAPGPRYTRLLDRRPGVVPDVARPADVAVERAESERVVTAEPVVDKPHVGGRPEAAVSRVHRVRAVVHAVGIDQDV